MEKNLLQNVLLPQFNLSKKITTRALSYSEEKRETNKT